MQICFIEHLFYFNSQSNQLGVMSLLHDWWTRWVVQSAGTSATLVLHHFTTGPTCKLLIAMHNNMSCLFYFLLVWVVKEFNVINFLTHRNKSVRPEPTRGNESSLPKLQPIRCILMFFIWEHQIKTNNLPVCTIIYITLVPEFDNSLRGISLVG